MGDLLVRPPTSDSFDKVLASKNHGNRSVSCKVPSSLAGVPGVISGVPLDFDEKISALVNDDVTSVHRFSTLKNKWRGGDNVRLCFEKAFSVSYKPSLHSLHCSPFRPQSASM